jgi:hypothetical protein
MSELMRGKQTLASKQRCASSTLSKEKSLYVTQ